MGFRKIWVLTAAFALGLCNAQADDIPPTTQARLLSAQASLGAALLQQEQQASPSDVIAVSPASVAGSLTAVFLGADAAVRAALATSLKLSINPMALRDLETLQASVIHRSLGDELSSATRIVFAPSSSPTPAASDRLAASGVDVAVEDLQKQDTAEEINTWAARATQGKITKVFDKPGPDARLVALNALYFAGRWLRPFDAEETRPADFTTAAGAHIRAPFMHSTPGEFARREDNDFVAVDLPFEGHRFSMVILTTKEEPTSFNGFISHLGWLAGTDFERPATRTVVDLPRFHATAKADLLPALIRTGLRVKGPFPNLTSTPVDISAIDQTFDMSIDEQGATIAAVTVTGFRVQSRIMFGGVSEIVIDKPFAFALREEKTGLVIGEGFVNAINGSTVAAGASLLSARSKSIMSDADWAHFKALAGSSNKQQQGVAKERLHLERDF